MLELLVCKCKDCRHWEIVRDAGGVIHLHCVTCGTNDPVELSVPETMNVHWEKRDSE